MVMNDDERWMRMALAEARKAGDMGEVPIGAVVVCKGIVVGKGHNLTETLGDVTAHAEIQAITAAAQTLGGKYLRECTLYVTVEPCLMCAGAIGWAQVPRIVVGAPDEKRGYSTLVARKPFHPRATVTEGVLAGECMALMQEFFRSRR
jgi:tRNA(adenine34) deaminase